VEHIFGGHLPDRTNLSSTLNPEAVVGYIREPTVAQKMHCVVMCISAPSATEPACLERLKGMKQAAMSKGVVGGMVHLFAQPLLVEAGSVVPRLDNACTRHPRFKNQVRDMM
jgi:hypothetical protein